jgi:periplasmic divalent cation tolerance protein
MTEGLKILYVPIDTLANAKKLARAVVEKKLAACANITPGVCSIYMWDGNCIEDQEVIIIFKTSASKKNALENYIAMNHPYDIPAILTYDAHANSLYSNWLRQSIED